MSEQQYQPIPAEAAETAYSPEKNFAPIVLLEAYAENKFNSTPKNNETAEQALERKQKQIDALYERAAEFFQNDAGLIGDELAKGFDQLELPALNNETENFDIEAATAEFVQKLTAKITSELQGQESKMVNAGLFIDLLTSVAINATIPAENTLTSAEKRAKATDAFRVVSLAAEAISFQDLAADAVTLGDHGWHHLYQDMRDALIIAKELKGTDLNNGEQLLIILTAAFHDIGYASPQISGPQQENSSNYGLDSGHPLMSFVFLQKNMEHFQKVLSPEDFTTFCTMVINHENPERADMAGEQSKLSESFAIADASASIGMEKLPPALAQIPELIGTMYKIAQVGENQAAGIITKTEAAAAIFDIKAQAKATLSEKYANSFTETHLKKLLNVLDDTHIDNRTVLFMLGRLAGEMGDITAEDNDKGERRIILTMNMGESKNIQAYIPEAVGAGATIATKVFMEQVGVKFTDAVFSQIKTYLLDPAQTAPLEVAGYDKTITVTRISGEPNSVALATDSLKVLYNADEKATKQSEFYNTILNTLKSVTEK